MKKLSMDELNRVDVETYRLQEKISLVVIMDNIRSMNNVGSIFRTCDAFSVESIWLCGITACPPNKEIAKTALGATESVVWNYAKETAEAVKQLKAQGYRIYAVEQVDTSIALNKLNINKKDKIAIILGNEVFGVSDEVLPLCDGAIEIPQTGTKHSLNVTIAGGIVIWELFQKLF
ncbi:MAG: RNA methyltransferase [Bacteroidales bacterium]|jgi:23S rRNA (guanosine2251-2'-O)-methyltransferase|nr:RNA methyltransferase [Bacteroidales bacterium]MDD4394286.1 RNA methyltransferase [Bacteroidales bacterium]